MTQLEAPTTYDGLVEAWLSAVEGFADAAETLSDSQWAEPSILPGWSNGDIVAHVVGIERDLLGDPTPTPDLDWDALPHADDPFSRYTELAVAERRAADPNEVRAELRKTIAARRELLAKEPEDLGEIVRGPGGWELPRGTVMRMRCFDMWTHDQDLRAATGEEGDLGTPAARVAAQQMLHGLGFVWARKVKAPTGSSATLQVQGPGLEFATTVVMGSDGRAVLGTPMDDPTVRIALPWPTFAALCTGRPVTDDVAIAGDPDLGALLLENLNVAP